MISREEAIEMLEFIEQSAEAISPHGLTVYTVAYNMAIEALEKQIPQKVVRRDGNYNCPACGKPAMAVSARKKKYCDFCGQAIDWSENE